MIRKNVEKVYIFLCILSNGLGWDKFEIVVAVEAGYL